MSVRWNLIPTRLTSAQWPRKEEQMIIDKRRHVYVLEGTITHYLDMSEEVRHARGSELAAVPLQRVQQPPLLPPASAQRQSLISRIINGPQAGPLRITKVVR